MAATERLPVGFALANRFDYLLFRVKPAFGFQISREDCCMPGAEVCLCRIEQSLVLRANFGQPMAASGMADRRPSARLATFQICVGPLLEEMLERDFPNLSFDVTRQSLDHESISPWLIQFQPLQAQPARFQTRQWLVRSSNDPAAKVFRPGSHRCATVEVAR